MLPGNNGVRIVFGQALRKPERVELAVQRRAADLEAPGDLRHLSAVMRNRKSNDLGFELFKRMSVVMLRRLQAARQKLMSARRTGNR